MLTEGVQILENNNIYPSSTHSKSTFLLNNVKCWPKAGFVWIDDFAAHLDPGTFIVVTGVDLFVLFVTYQPTSLLNERMYTLFHGLLRHKGEVQHMLLDWIAKCLHANKGTRRRARA